MLSARRAPRTQLWSGLMALAMLGCSNESSPLPPSRQVASREAVHRLNTAEYNATVGDVLGTKLEPATSSWREGELLGFDNIASVLNVDARQYERYFAAAKAIAADVIGSEALRARLLACDAIQSECVNASIEGAGRRLFRRPLTSEEQRIYAGLHARALGSGDTPTMAFQLVLQAMLASAPFIYRIELEPSATSEPQELGAFDLASRLSYFLWSSAPDDALLTAAQNGSLLEEPTLLASIDRLLADPKAARFIERFAGQWLGARRVAAHAAAPQLYQWTPQVARAAGDEIVSYFGETVTSDRSWFDFLKTDVNYVTEPLARFYGIPTPEVERARVEQHADGRAGFFGLAGFLAVSSFDRRTSPSLRGRWISSNMLCADPPAPPQDVPKLETVDSGDTAAGNVRQILEQHRQNPACSTCHSLFDPYGMALEEYDAVGQYRATYADGSPVDATAVLPASPTHPDGLSFSGLAGLSEVVTADPRFGACLAQKLLTYGLGRRLEASDSVALAGAVERWQAAGEVPSVRRLIRELVRSDAFRRRLPEGTP